MRGDALDPMLTAQLAVFAAIATFVVHLAMPDLDRGTLFVIAAALGASFLALRFVFDRFTRRKGPRRDHRFAEPSELLDAERHDLVGLRVAIERTVAVPILAELTEAARGPDQGRASRVARVLLAHRGAWCFAGLDATVPLPVERASQVFEGWCTDVRARFSRESSAQGEPFRWHPLVVISLHVASPGRISEIDVRDPTAAERALVSLRDHSEGWATRVDLWSSERDFTAAELREADPTLLDLSEQGRPAEARFASAITGQRR